MLRCDDGTKRPYTIHQPVKPAPRRRPAPSELPSDGTILLTGATGFVGGALLQALLQYTQYRVCCLVRAPRWADEKGEVLVYFLLLKLLNCQITQ